MNVLIRKKSAMISSLVVALLLFLIFQPMSNAADIKLNVSECIIKDKTLSYVGKIDKGEIAPITVMVRKKDNPSDIRYMRIISPDNNGSFADNVRIYDKEETSDLFDMEVLFQADENVPAVSFELVYFNDMKKSENVDAMRSSVKGMLEFMSSDEEGIKIYNNIGVRLDLYNGQSPSVKDKIDTAANKFKATATTENVVEIANGSIYAVVAGEVKSADELINIISGFDLESKSLHIKKNSVANTKRYTELTKTDQVWIASNVYDNMPNVGFKDYEELYDAIRRSIFLRFANKTHYMELNELILSNTDILENEMTSLKNTTNSDILDTAMANISKQAEKSNFTNITTYISAVNSALTKASEGDGKDSDGTIDGNGSLGGNSGGNSGGGIQISVAPGVESGVVNNNLTSNDDDNSNNQFSDLAGYDWAKEAVRELAVKGIVNGVSDDKFEPSRSITREEFVKLICMTFDFGIGSGAVQFKDVDENSWYAPYVCRAVELGIIEGISDTEFGTGFCITREDMATIIYRCMEKIGIELIYERQSFSDEDDIAEYAKYPIMVLFRNDIINGIGDNLFAPKENASRAEAAVIIYRCMEKVGR